MTNSTRQIGEGDLGALRPSDFVPGESHDAAVLTAFASFVDSIKRAPISWETGVCCCGNAVADHGFGDGHSPVDEGVHFISGAIRDAEAAILKARSDGVNT